MIIAILGVRPELLGGYKAFENFKKIRRHMRDFLDQAPEGPITIITGGQQGVEQFALEVAQFMELPCEVVLPPIGYDSKWPKESKKKNDLLLEKATCSQSESYEERYHKIIDSCDILLTYWDFDDIACKNVIDYAIFKNKIINEFNVKDIIGS